MTRFLSLCLILLYSFNGHTQSVLAGCHQSGDFFVDIIPDTTLVGPNTHIPPQPPATFQIDIDGDHSDDFELYSLGFWMNGGGGTQISIRARRSNCQIALCCTDSCQGNIARSLKKYDSIGMGLAWSSDTILYLSHTYWNLQPYSCYYNGFVNDSLGNYLAVRVMNTADTIYGWIKVTNIDWSAYTVQEFASSVQSSGIEERQNDVSVYPVPAKDFVMIETQMPCDEMTLYNQYGIELIKKRLAERKTRIDMRDLQNGIYFIQCRSGNSVVIKKIVR